MRPPIPLARAALALALVAGTLAAAPAAAQAPAKGALPAKGAAKGAPAADKPAEDEAKLRADGLRLLKAGKWEDARVLLAAAYKVKPTWQNALDLGRAELGAGKHRDAAEHLYAGLRDAGKELSDADRKAAEALFAQVQPKVAALRFDVKPAGAEIFVGGKSVGKAPIESPIFVVPGPAELEIKADGHTPMRATKTADAGEETPVEVELTRAKLPPPPPPPPPPSPLRGVSMPLFIGGVAGTGALAIAGGVFAILSAVKASKSHAVERPDAECWKTGEAACRAEFDALQKSKVTFAGASMWTFIGSGALLLGTAGYTVFTIIKRPPLTMNAGLVVTPDQAGVTFTGRF